MKVNGDFFEIYGTYNNNISEFKSFIDTKYPKWRFVTIYDKETREKLDVWKR